MSEPKYIRKYGLSPSMINDWEGCPKRFEGVRILKKTKFVETHQIKWGNEVHTALENYVKTGEVLPSYLEHMIPVIQGLRDKGFKLYPEIPMSVNRQWQACDWWAKDCMARGKVDLFALKPGGREAYVIDYKTGKRKTGQYRDDTQLNLYGVMAITALGLTDVRSWFFWLAEKAVDFSVVNASNVQILRNQFSTRIKTIDDAYASGNFPAKASPLCSYCPFLLECDEAVFYRSRARFLKGGR